MIPNYIQDTDNFWVSVDGTKYPEVSDIPDDHLRNLVPFILQRIQEGEAIYTILDREGKKALKRLKKRYNTMLKDTKKRGILQDPYSLERFKKK